MSEELFKTTLMGGFDKDDVLAKMKNFKDEAYAEKSKLIKAGKEKDKKIKELQNQINLNNIQKDEEIEELKEEHRLEMRKMERRLAEKNAQKEKLEHEISEKYQKYIDRYDLIGGLILEAQEKAEHIISDAVEKRDMLMQEARVEAQKYLDAVQSEVDEKLAEGKRKYIAVQEEMNEIVQLINEAQKRFMASYKEVHRIISTMPESMKELEDENEEEKGRVAELKNSGNDSIKTKTTTVVDKDDSEGMESFDEEDDAVLEEELMRILEKEVRDEE